MIPLSVVTAAAMAMLKREEFFKLRARWRDLHAELESVKCRLVEFREVAGFYCGSRRPSPEWGLPVPIEELPEGELEEALAEAALVIARGGGDRAHLDTLIDEAQRRRAKPELALDAFAVKR